MPSIDSLRGPWLLCAAALLLAAAARRAPRPRAGELWLVGVVCACAVSARVVGGVWGPLHVNGQGPLWIRGALDPAALASYGPGYFELFTSVTRLGAAPDRAVFAANALLSGLSPALLYAAARVGGVERGGALAVALVLAADPVAIRTAASEGYFSPLILLVLGVQASLALALQARARRDRLATGLAVAAASLLAAAAARIHPAGYLPLGLCPLVLLGGALPESWRARAKLAALAAAAIGATVLIGSGATILGLLRTSPGATRALDSIDLPHAGLMVALLAAAWLLGRWIRMARLPLLAILSLGLMLATRDGYCQHPMWELCYERLFWPGLLLGVAPLLPRRLQAPRWAIAAAGVVAAAVLVTALPHLVTPTTEQLEYRFLQEVLAETPAGCTLASVSSASVRVWEIPSYLIPSRGSRRSEGRAVTQTSDLRAVAGCVLYVRASICTSVEARALCESVEREVALERVASRVLAAEPSYAFMPYDRPSVEVVVFRVVTTGAVLARTRAVADGAAITPAFAQSLYDRIATLRERDGCHVVRLDTSRSRITVGLQTRSGEQHVLGISTAAHDASATHAASGWALAVSDELEIDCGETLVAIERSLSDPRPAPLQRR